MKTTFPKPWAFPFFLLIASLSCPLAFAAPFVNTAQTTSATTSLSATDIDVIQAICNRLQGWDKGREIQDGAGVFVAILDENKPPKPKFTVFLPSFLAEEKTTDTLKSSLSERNRKTFALEKRIVRPHVTLIGSNEMNQLVVSGRFVGQFPSMVGSADFWLPSYNGDATECAVYVFCRGGDGMDQWGRLYRLRRQARSWAVTGNDELWRT